MIHWGLWRKKINIALSKYIKFWKHNIEQNATYANKLNPYVKYWWDVLLHLPKPPQSSILLEGFWPSRNWRSNFSRALLLNTMEVVDVEDLIVVLYCGSKNLKFCLKTTSYTSFKHFNKGDFAFMRLHDLKLILMWMGRKHNDIIKDDENIFFKMVKV